MGKLDRRAAAFDLFDLGSESQPGERQTDLEDLIAEENRTMNAYERKQEAKRERLEAAADRARAAADAAYKRADMREEKSGIPFGQPILVGHHSEGRHRAAIKRADNAMRASIEADKRAGDLAARAAAVGSGGISSDDPDAIAKLKKQAADGQARQDFMRDANKLVRKARKAGITDSESEGFEDYRASLAALNDGVMNASAAAALLQPDFAGRVGFADYQLQNNGANVKRIQKRIAQLEAVAAKAEEVEGGELRQSFQGLCDLVENFEENRIQILFDGKPGADVRSALKSYGFRWAPSQSAWQRQLNNAGRYAAKQFLRSQGVEA